MTKTYHGSCHCGAVRFEAELDIGSGTSRCNCSICGRTRFWKAIVKPDAFRLVAGEEMLADYQFGTHTIHHRFCRRCGVKPFGEGTLPEPIGAFYAVNIMCLDATEEELATARVTFEDGKNNNWFNPPAETRYL